MPRIPKYRVEIIVQGYYPGAGWSDETGATDSADAKIQLKTYRENCPGTAFRVVRRREANPNYKAA